MNIRTLTLLTVLLALFSTQVNASLITMKYEGKVAGTDFNGHTTQWALGTVMTFEGVINTDNITLNTHGIDKVNGWFFPI